MGKMEGQGTGDERDREMQNTGMRKMEEQGTRDESFRERQNTGMREDGGTENMG